MEVDSAPATSNPLPTEPTLPDSENPSIPAQTIEDDDIDMDAPDAAPGVKKLSGSAAGAGVASGRAGGDASKEGFGSVAAFFQPKKAVASGSSGVNGKGKEKSGTGMGNGNEEGEGVIDHIATREGLPWVEKYRPDSLDDVVSHKDITGTIENFIKKGRLPHLLFYGPPGTGKTSTILAIAKLIYGPTAWRSHVLELNASDDRGIDVVREQVKGFAMTRVLFSKGFKLIILDEADMMTQAAQSALRRVIEQYTKNVRFCILCNYVNKITPAIQSRCTKFRFSPLPEKEVEKKVMQVVDREGVKLTDDGKAALLKLSRGDMRRALNILQACHAAYDEVDEMAVYNCTGNPEPKDVEACVESMMRDEFGTSYEYISKLKTEKGLALQDLVSGIYDVLETVKLPKQSRAYLLDALSTCEYRLSIGGSEKVQLTSLLGAFKVAVELSQK